MGRYLQGCLPLYSFDPDTRGKGRRGGGGGGGGIGGGEKLSLDIWCMQQKFTAKHVAHDVLHKLHEIWCCTWFAQMQPGHVSVHVGDSSRHSEGMVKIWNCAFRYDYHYDYYYHYYTQLSGNFRLARLGWCVHPMSFPSPEVDCSPLLGHPLPQVKVWLSFEPLQLEWQAEAFLKEGLDPVGAGSSFTGLPSL